MTFTKENRYYCSKCRVEIIRKDTRKWINSYCGDTHQSARLILIKENRMFGVEVVFYDRNGYWSKPYTYLSTEFYEKGSVVIVPKLEFFSIGKVYKCTENPKLDQNITYKHIVSRADV